MTGSKSRVEDSVRCMEKLCNAGSAQCHGNTCQGGGSQIFSMYKGGLPTEVCLGFRTSNNLAYH